MLAISLNIAVMSAKKIIGHTMKQRARSGRWNNVRRFYSSSLQALMMLNACVTRFYSGSPRAALWVTARFAFYHFLLTRRNPLYFRAAAKQSAEAAHTLINYTREKNGLIERVHSVANSYLKHWMKATRML